MTIPPETAEISHSGLGIGGESAAIHSTKSGVKLGFDRQLAVQYRPVSTLILYARNARTHSERQVAEIAASIREFGWTNPILVDGDNGFIAGHGRLLAARKLCMTDVPVIELLPD
ncbi:ParB/Srx family N-terminal domain-containing protein [Mesorhizobium sp. CN2-181]|uniref:ParB/Srx family N-terminal domain-containing protein n=1 Tax=Mesorhizobium yinganensis TaxID=3157707 RepID=UPI0032B7D058